MSKSLRLQKLIDEDVIRYVPLMRMPIMLKKDKMTDWLGSFCKNYLINGYLTFGTTALALCSASAAWAAAPSQESGIPIYPGAKLDPNAIESREATPMSQNAQAKVKVYLVNASVEEVIRFYKSKFGTDESKKDEISADQLAPGSVSSVAMSLNFHRFGTQYDPGGKPYFTEAQQKEVLTKCRPSYQPGKWVSDGHFTWSSKGRDSSMNSFVVSAQDDGIAQHWKGCAKKTKIVVQADHTRSEAETDLEADQAAEQRLNAEMKKLGTNPSEKTVGAPIYPGAKYDARNSAGMSMDEQRVSVFMSNDSSDKVVKFYETKLGKKAKSPDGMSFIIAIKGEYPMPKQGVTIQPNTMFGGSAKTVITINKPK